MTRIESVAKAGLLGFEAYANPSEGLANSTPSTVVHLTFRWRYYTLSTTLLSLGDTLCIPHTAARDPAGRHLCVAGESSVKIHR